MYQIRSIITTFIFVDNDISVAEGNKLIIQQVTLIKFRGDFSFNINGYISAIGTPEDPIVFQSGMPSPLEGDWQRITLNNSNKSTFSIL